MLSKETEGRVNWERDGLEGLAAIAAQWDRRKEEQDQRNTERKEQWNARLRYMNK